MHGLKLKCCGKTWHEFVDGRGADVGNMKVLKKEIDELQAAVNKELKKVHDSKKHIGSAIVVVRNSMVQQDALKRWTRMRDRVRQTQQSNCFVLCKTRGRQI